MAEAPEREVPGAAYFPPPESRGGWRWLASPGEVREIGGMDPDRLQLAAEHHAMFATPAAVAVVRRGYLVAEWLEISALPTTRFDVWSATKSFTGTAFGLLFEDSRRNRLPAGGDGSGADGRGPASAIGGGIDLDTPAYDHIPEGHPLSDPRKAGITLRHLLSMTSGIPGESTGIAAVPTPTGVGPFEAALGFAPCWARRWAGPRWAATLTAPPGERWDYSDPAMAHLSLVFWHVAGREMRDYLRENLFSPIGIEGLSWDLQGVGTRFGPHTNAHTGIHVSARELARFGYLMLRRGVWAGRELVPSWWIDLATRTSQPHNPAYGYTWWVNTAGDRWPALPRDAFAALGLNCNACYVVPSLDLVVARTGSGPLAWPDAAFISKVVDAVVDP